MALGDLGEIYENCSSEISEQWANLLVQRSLPEEFKESFSKLGKIQTWEQGTPKWMDGTTVFYNEYVRFIPNQWFYLSALTAPYLKVLNEYKNHFVEVCNSAGMGSNEKKDLAISLSRSPDKLETISSYINLRFDELEDRERFKRFLTDYDWWRGSKKIDRGDFWTAPIRKLAGLVMEDGATFADICLLMVEVPLLQTQLVIPANQRRVVSITGNVREVARKLVEFVIIEYGDQRFLDSLEERGGIYGTISPRVKLFIKKETEQTIDELSTGEDSTQRYFEEPVSRYEDSYWYMSNQWTNTGGEGNQELTRLINHIERAYPELTVSLKVSGDIEITKMETSSSTEAKSKQVKLNIDEEGFATGGTNLIVYGAPGTGKSFYLEEKYPSAIRTVFHGEYSNSDFIGSIRPSMVEGKDQKKEVAYDFNPGPFAVALANSYNNPEVNVALLIEEINRGDAANIFGEVFQLLDRDEKGKSEYRININPGFKAWLEETAPHALDSEEKICLPSNLSIVATMNSSDQGVRAMDSAFKRRWRFIYRPIDYSNCEYKGEFVKYNNRDILWETFAGSLNKVLAGSSHIEEDRLIGPYFLKRSEVIDQKMISEKLLLYLWDDVLRHRGRDQVFNTKKFNSFSKLQIAFGIGELVFSTEVNDLLGVGEESDPEDT